MKTTQFFPIALTVLFVFVTLHVSAIFYIANATEQENNKKSTSIQVHELNMSQTGNHIAYQHTAIK